MTIHGYHLHLDGKLYILADAPVSLSDNLVNKAFSKQAVGPGHLDIPVNKAKKKTTHNFSGDSTVLFSKARPTVPTDPCIVSIPMAFYWHFPHKSASL